MADTLAFTAAEAAFVLQEPIKSVKKAFDDGPIEPKLVGKAGGLVRAIEWADLLYLVAARALRDELTPKARDDLYQALKRSPVERLHEIRFGRLSVAIDDFKAEIDARARDLATLAEKVEVRADGTVVLKDTGIEVYRISALVDGGLSAEDICADFPSLTSQQVADAEAYALARPKMGRPYPKTSFKRAMQDVGLEALDADV